MAYFRAFVRFLPNSFPRDFYSFPWNFENVRQNRENIRQNLRKVGENQEKVGEYRGKLQKFPQKEWDKREKSGQKCLAVLTRNPRFRVNIFKNTRQIRNPTMTSQPIHLLRQENLYKGHYQLLDEGNAQLF